MDICRICGHAEDNRVFWVREMMFGLRERFAYFQCADCRCLQIRDFPTDMAKYYPDNYYSLQASLPAARTRLEKLACAAESSFRLKVNNRIFGRSRRTRIFDWMRGTRSKRDSAIVDVGCGRGKLLHELHMFAFRDLTGVDPYVANELRYDNGIVVHKCELSELDRRFDLIMMHHTFEHVPDPEATLLAAFDRLHNGGYLLVRIPVVDCYAWRHYGVDWFALDAPRHFYLHTEKSLSLLATRTGFFIERVEYDSGAHQLWGSEQYKRDIAHRSPSSYEENPKASIFTQQQIRAFDRMSRELSANRDGDSACFYLRCR